MYCVPRVRRVRGDETRRDTACCVVANTNYASDNNKYVTKMALAHHKLPQVCVTDTQRSHGV